MNLNLCSSFVLVLLCLWNLSVGVLRPRLLGLNLGEVKESCWAEFVRIVLLSFGLNPLLNRRCLISNSLGRCFLCAGRIGKDCTMLGHCLKWTYPSLNNNCSWLSGTNSNKLQASDCKSLLGFVSAALSRFIYNIAISKEVNISAFQILLVSFLVKWFLRKSIIKHDRFSQCLRLLVIYTNNIAKKIFMKKNNNKYWSNINNFLLVFFWFYLLNIQRSKIYYFWINFSKNVIKFKLYFWSPNQRNYLDLKIKIFYRIFSLIVMKLGFLKPKKCSPR